jgi:hypothetical protein
MGIVLNKDFFGDGSGVEQIKFDGNLTTENGTTLTLVQSAGAVAPTYIQGKYGQAISFDALTGAHTATPLPVVVGANQTDSWTLSVWFKEGSAPNFNEEFLDVFVNGGIKTELYATATNELYVYSSGEIHHTIPNAWNSTDLTKWHNFIVTSTGYKGFVGASYYAIYVDGVLVGSGATTPRKTAIEDRLDVNVFAGAVNSGGIPRAYDNIRIFSRYIYPSEVIKLYNERLTIVNIIQSGTINNYNSLYFYNKSTIMAFTVTLFTQEETVKREFSDNFAQHSITHEYRPYTDISLSNNFITNATGIDYLFTFENTNLDTTTTKSVDVVGGITQYGIGKNGTVSLRANGTTSASIVNVDFSNKWYSFWLKFGNFSSTTDIIIIDTHVLDFPTYNVPLKAYIDTLNRLHLLFRNVEYVSSPNEFADTPLQIVYNRTDTTTYISINGFKVVSANTDLLMDKYWKATITVYSSNFIGDIDQLRFGTQSLDDRYERAVIWDAVSVKPFEQLFTINNYSKNILRNQSTLMGYTSAIFTQNHTMFNGDIAIFTQQSTTSYWAKLGIFSQVETIEAPAQTTIIKRA